MGGTLSGEFKFTVFGVVTLCSPETGGKHTASIFRVED
jgi:hypothetical protein